MKEITDFLKLLYQRRLILIAIPVITAIAAFFIVRTLPDPYIAPARMATGIADQGERLLADGGRTDQHSINQEFDNLIQMIRLKKIVNQVSYQLILHDLTTETPFRERSSEIRKLDQATLDSAILIYTQKHAGKEELSAWNKTERQLHELLVSMKYDENSLSKKLSVYRVGNSDFIDLEFTAEDPELAAFVVNTLSSEFISYYTSRVKESNTRTVDFLDSLLKQRQTMLANTMESLKKYKIQNRVLNLGEQAKSLYGQIADFETRREIAEQDIISYTAALKNIDAKFNPTDRQYLESALSSTNQQIASLKEQLKAVNGLYIQNNFDNRYKARLDSLKTALSAKISEASDHYIYNPMVAKENLITQKLNMEVSLELARNSVQSIDQELARLNRKFDSLVPHEAEIQAYESNIDITGREYIELLQKYNQASIISSIPLQLRQIEQAEPGELQASKKMVLVVFAGLLSFVFCVGTFFILFLLDKTIRDPYTLANKTGQPVLGVLPHTAAIKDPEAVWMQETDPDTRQFRDNLRMIRLELDSLLPDKKIFAITGLGRDSGKDFVTQSLAAAFAATHKNVLVIEGDFRHPTLPGSNNNLLRLEDFLTGTNLMPSIDSTDKRMYLMTNKMRDTALSELADKMTIKEKTDLLRSMFDVILIVTAPLDEGSNAREWLTYADSAIAVYPSGTAISETQKQQIADIGSSGTAFAGWVLNKA